MSPAPARAPLWANEADFEGDYRKYYRKTVAWACHFGLIQDCEDIAQQAWLSAWRDRSSFQHRSSFVTWMHRIVFNLCIGARRGKALSWVSLREDFDPVDYADMWSDHGEFCRHQEAVFAVNEALAKLPVKIADQVWIRYAGGEQYTKQEPSSGKVRAWRGLQILKGTNKE